MKSPSDGEEKRRRKYLILELKVFASFNDFWME